MSLRSEFLGGSGRPPSPPRSGLPGEPGAPLDDVTTSAPAPGAAAIAVRDLDIGYGSFVVQRNLNFEVGRGKVFIVMGGSGCGKSTVLRVMIGLVPPLRGEVIFGGSSLWAARSEERRVGKAC